MKKLFLYVIFIFPCVVLCQNCDDKFYVIIENSAGVEKIHLKGRLCDDTFFCIDNESKILLENTKGVDGGLAILYDKEKNVRRKLYIVGVYEQDATKFTDYALYCDLDGCLSDINDCIIFPNGEKDPVVPELQSSTPLKN